MTNFEELTFKVVWQFMSDNLQHEKSFNDYFEASDFQIEILKKHKKKLNYCYIDAE